jgi:hypothetical protein
VYYIVQQGSEAQTVLSEEADQQSFWGLVGELLERWRIRVHGGYADGNSFHLALQVKNFPVARFMDDLKALYAKKYNRRHGTHGRLWGCRYTALLIDPRMYLTKLIHYIHYLPQLRHGLSLETHSSSHLGYLGLATSAWLTTTVVMAMLGDRRSRCEAAYRELMAQPPTEQEIHEFEHGSPHEPRVLGGPVFLRQLPQDVVPYHTVQTLDDVIALVAINHHLSVDELFSRKQTAVIARAVIAWHATTRDIATLSTVARHFNREPQTLYESMHLHRNSKPEIFEPSALQRQATPLVARFQETSLSEDAMRDLEENDHSEHADDDEVASDTRTNLREDSIRVKCAGRRLSA